MSEETKYRVAAKCHECGESWTTNAKTNDKPPHECRECGSTKTGKEETYEVTVE